MGAKNLQHHHVHAYAAVPITSLPLVVLTTEPRSKTVASLLEVWFGGRGDLIDLSVGFTRVKLPGTAHDIPYA